ncbi:hypothetical protein H0X32_00660 [Patescibacteria group bacterium]|nr:hypothetical protein [Patescibacteria group bacterium]
MTPADPPIDFLNIAYFFQLIYNAIFIFRGSSANGFADFASALWIFVTIIAYLISFFCIGLLVYFTMRLHQISRDEDPKYATIPKEIADVQLEHSRWAYIRQLIESPQESDWRQAIIEADIMLDELLSKLGLLGNGVGDKLKLANASHFRTLQDAWEAHRVRNEIAHQGFAYKLSDQLAYRTIGHYENVFREFNEI